MNEGRRGVDGRILEGLFWGHNVLHYTTRVECKVERSKPSRGESYVVYSRMTGGRGLSHWAPIRQEKVTSWWGGLQMAPHHSSFIGSAKKYPVSTHTHTQFCSVLLLLVLPGRPGCVSPTSSLIGISQEIRALPRGGERGEDRGAGRKEQDLDSLWSCALLCASSSAIVGR